MIIIFSELHFKNKCSQDYTLEPRYKLNAGAIFCLAALEFTIVDSKKLIFATGALM